MVGIADRAAPGKLRLPVGIEQTPVSTDAAFDRDLPWLVDRFDDVVVDAIGIRARNEIAQDDSLLGAAGVGQFHVVTAARPAELGDDNALAGIEPAQRIVTTNGGIDGSFIGYAFPVRQDVDGDVVDRRHQFRMIAPHAPDFTGGDRHGALTLHALDHLDQAFDCHRLFRGGKLLGLGPGAKERSFLLAGNVFVGRLKFAAEDRFVADHDAVDVVVALGEIDRVANLTLVARGCKPRRRIRLLGFADPGADIDLETLFSGRSRDQFGTVRRRIGTDGARVWRQQIHVAANLVDIGSGVFAGRLVGWVV